MKTLVNIAAPFEQRNILLTSGVNHADTGFKNIKGNTPPRKTVAYHIAATLSSLGSARVQKLLFRLKESGLVK